MADSDVYGSDSNNGRPQPDLGPGHNRPSGDASDPRGEGPDSFDPDALRRAEEGGGSGAAGSTPKDDKKSGDKSFSFNPNDRSQRGNLGNVLGAASKHRKAILIGTAGGAGAGGTIAVLFFILIPLKIEHIVSNLENRFMSTSENAVQKESNNMLSDYIKKYVVPALTSCRGHDTISKDCNPSFGTSGNPVDNLYKGWSQARLENKLATDFGLEIRFDTRNHKYYMNAPGIKNPNGDDITSFVDDPHNREYGGNLFQQVSRGQIRASVDNALSTETGWKGTLLRYKTGRLLEEKYGVTRCLIFCNARDALSDKKDSVLGGLTERKEAAQIYLVQRVLIPLDNARGIAIACLLSSSCDPTSTQPTTAEDGTTGELNGAPENPDTDTALRQQLEALATAEASGSIDDALSEYGKMKEGGAQQYAVNWVLEKVGLNDLSDQVNSAFPVIGWLQKFSNIITDLANAGPKVKKLSFLTGSAGAVGVFSMLQTYADEIHTGHVNATEVGSMTDMLSSGDHGPSSDPEVGGTAGAEQTPLYGNLIDGSTAASAAPTSFVNDILPGTAYAASSSSNSSYKCKDGKGVPLGSLVCPEEKLGGGNDSLNAVSSFLHQGFIGKITDGANIVSSGPFKAIQNLGGDLIGFIVTHIPGVSSLTNLVSNALTPFFKSLLTDVLPSALGSNNSGGRIFDEAAVGADLVGSETSHTLLGGGLVTAKAAASIASAQQNEARQQFSHESFFARMFSTDSPYSLVSTIAMDIPFSVQASAESSFATFISNPFGVLTRSFAVIFSGQANAAASALTGLDSNGNDFAGINQYSPSVPNHPEADWNQNCSDNASYAYMKDDSWNQAAASYDAANNTAQDPSAQPVNTTANPCLTTKATVCASGVTSDTSLCSSDDLADVNGGSGGSGNSTPTPVSGNAQQLAQQILNNNNVDLTCLSSSVQQDVQDAANGQPGTAGVMTSAGIMQIIAAVGQSHKVCVTAIQSDGQGHCGGEPKSVCPNDPHYTGNAVDFGSLDDVPITGRNAPALTIMKIADSTVSTGAFGQSECGATPSLPSGWSDFDDTCNHLHVQNIAPGGSS